MDEWIIVIGHTSFGVNIPVEKARELKIKTKSMETSNDDDQPATKGEMRAFSTRLDDLTTKVGLLIAQKTGVEASSPVIPEAETVVKEGRFFAHISEALHRHKGRCVKIVRLMPVSKKRK